jgi:hypothetical protein
MKAARDSQRKLASVVGDTESWQATMVSLIYVIFSGFESARKAVDNPVEFLPTRAENRAAILLTELECYRFLLEYLTKKNDRLRQARLMLRECDYNEIVPALITKITKPHGKNERYWLAAKELKLELKQRYDLALEAIAVARSRID